MKHLLFHFLVLSMLLGSTATQAQWVDDCGAGDAPEHVADWLKKLDHEQLSIENTNSDTTWLAAQIFLVHAPTGQPAISIDSLMRTFQVLNRRYAPAKIQFYLAGMPRYIVNQIWSNPPDKQVATLMIDSFNIPRVVNIYFTNLGSQGLCGYAYYPNSGPGTLVTRGAAMMSYSCSGPESGTLAHELGHFFSLPHPFQGTSGDPSGPTAERVTRDFNEVSPRLSANCNTAGDFFCDTKADPYSARWQCVSTPITLDINGDRFFADSSLVMSYAANTCRDIFSEQQMNAMRSTVATGTSSRGYLLARQRPVTTPIVDQPQILTPAAGELDVQPNFAHFNWTAVPGATWYHFRLKRAIIPGLVKDTVVQGTYLSIYDNKMNVNTDYQWSVTAVNENDYYLKPYTWHNFRTGTRTATFVQELNQSAVQIYPNPIRRGESLRIGKSQGISLNLQVYDLLGRTVFTAQLGTNDDRLTLPENLMAGQYVIEWIDQTGKRGTQRLLIQPE